MNDAALIKNEILSLKRAVRAELNMGKHALLLNAPASIVDACTANIKKYENRIKELEAGLASLPA